MAFPTTHGGCAAGLRMTADERLTELAVSEMTPAELQSELNRRNISAVVARLGDSANQCPPTEDVDDESAGGSTRPTTPRASTLPASTCCPPPPNEDVAHCAEATVDLASASGALATVRDHDKGDPKSEALAPRSRARKRKCARQGPRQIRREPRPRRRPERRKTPAATAAACAAGPATRNAPLNATDLPAAATPTSPRRAPGQRWRPLSWRLSAAPPHDTSAVEGVKALRRPTSHEPLLPQHHGQFARAGISPTAKPGVATLRKAPLATQ